MKRFITIFVIFCFLLAPAESFAASKTLKAETTQTTVALKWTGATAKEKKKISGFAIYKNDKLVKKVKKTAKSYKQKGLKAGKRYKFQIKTYKITKKKEWYNKKTKKWTTKKPIKKYRGKSRPKVIYKNYTSAKTFRTQYPSFAAPKVSIRAQGDENLPVAVILSWKPVTEADKFKVYKGDEVFEVSGDTLMWTDYDVDWATKYTYKVSAVKGKKEAPSKEVSITTPNEPKPLTVDDGVYKDVSDAYDVLTEFRMNPKNWWQLDSRNQRVELSGLYPLERDVALENAAKVRAREQWIQYYENNKRTHDRPDGQPYTATYIEQGVNTATENLGWANNGSAREMIFGKGVPGDDGWAEDFCQYYEQGHRRAMLMTGSNATKVGIACFTVGDRQCWAMAVGY